MESNVLSEQNQVYQLSVQLHNDVAEGVIGDLLQHVAGLTQHQLHRVQVAGQQPVDGGRDSES